MTNGHPLNNEPELPGYIQEAIRAILDYLWDDELAHYLETSPREGRNKHIFNTIRRVDRWLVRHERRKR
ncbi:MAG TPA: hypothetical protein PKY77_25425 [Phycisphaerae bacterium]|nr:hypothetical protein [Phycisphaerae bacterium]HRY69814.1 hypothetical protein [Phycisphaerae bacterium]HSA25353.1 hypothetical protein [Phycisphaerae bacterium]